MTVLSMIECNACGKSNSLDSKYCRGCGAALPAEELAAAEQENEKLIADGRRLFAESRTDEALLVAEAALATDPTSVSALTLLGDCLEQDGRIEEALEAYEKVLEIQPTSTLDRVKVQHLRRKLSAQALEEAEPPNRRLAVIAALVATLGMIAVGSWFVMASAPPATASGSGQDSFRSEAFSTQNPPARDDKATPSNPANPLPDTSNDGRIAGPRRTTTPGGFAMPLPGASQNGYTPWTPEGIEIAPTDQQPQQPQPTEPSQPTTPTPAEAEPADNSVIDIRPSRRNPTQQGGGEFVDEGDSAESHRKQANQAFQLGDMQAAARHLEAAVAKGGGTGDVYQRLGQAYKGSDTSKAISAYQRAIAADEAALRKGTGDRALIQRRLETNRAALRSLQGR